MVFLVIFSNFMLSLHISAGTSPENKNLEFLKLDVSFCNNFQYISTSEDSFRAFFECVNDICCVGKKWLCKGKGAKNWCF